MMEPNTQKTVEDLKKENFDLKLRLYMTQKDVEPVIQSSPEYETKVIALVHRLEQQQSIDEDIELELKAARVTEISSRAPANT